MNNDNADKKKYSLSQAKEIPGRDKPVWLNIGRAFEKDGRIARIKLDVLPLPDEKGEIWLNIFEDKPREQNQASNGNDYGDDSRFLNN